MQGSWGPATSIKVRGLDLNIQTFPTVPPPPGQMAVLRNHPRAAPLIQEMWEHEMEHLRKFEELLATYKVQPTIFVPLWKAAGFTLGQDSNL